MIICIKQHLSNIWRSIHEKVKQRWGWLEKKALVYKKACILFVPIMKMYLIHVLFRREFEVAFAWIVKKSVFLVQISWILKLWFKDWPLLHIFTKVFTFCSKHDMRQIVKRNLFYSNNAHESRFFNSLRHQKLLLVANQLQDSSFVYLILTMKTLPSVN